MRHTARTNIVRSLSPKTGLFALFALGAGVFEPALAPARAEQWQPTVVTTAGAEVEQRVAPQPLPRWADPNLIAAPRPKMGGRLSPQRPLRFKAEAPTPAPATAVVAPLAAETAPLPVPAAVPVADPFVPPAGAEPSPMEARVLKALEASSIETGSIAAPKPTGLEAWSRASRPVLPLTQVAASEAAPAAAAPAAAQHSEPGHAAPGEKAAGTAAHSPASAAAGAAPVAAPAGAPATGAPAPAAAASDRVIPRAAGELPNGATAAQQYCFNTAEAVGDARVAWQAKRIKDMEGELEKRVAELTAKTEEYKTWLQRRDDFARKAQDKIVAFYAKMKSDAAALQLSAMDEDLAAALLMKLEPKAASLILAEIEPQRAAKITAILSGVAKKPPERRAKSANAGAGPAAGGAAAPAGAPVPALAPAQAAPPAAAPAAPQAQAQPGPPGEVPAQGEASGPGRSKS